MTFSFDEAYRHIAEIRSMIQHENTLLNTRMGWMWALQGLLFSSMSFLWPIHNALVVLVAIVGLLSTISIGYSCVRASKSVRELLRISKEFKKTTAKAYELPPTIGARTKGVQWLLPWKFLTFVFGAAWVFIIFFRLNITT